MTDPYTHMLEVILPQCVEHFKRKSGDYGPEGFTDLGVKGQFSDMWRKMLKLKRGLWEGKPLALEQSDEILKDLFGHLLISLYLLEEPDDGGPEEDDEPHPHLWSDRGRCAAWDMNSNPIRRCCRPVHGSETTHLF